MPNKISVKDHGSYIMFYAADEKGKALSSYAILYGRQELMHCCGLGELAGFSGSGNLLNYVKLEEVIATILKTFHKKSYIYTLSPYQLNESLHLALVKTGAVTQMGDPWQNENYPGNPSHLLRTFMLNLAKLKDVMWTFDSHGYVVAIPQDKEKSDETQTVPAATTA